MAKSFKYKDDIFLDSTGIVHNKELLSSKIINSSGSNENGKYIKFEDGTMICTGTKKYTGEADFTQDSIIYYKDVGAYVFPANFIEIPSINVTNVNDNYTRRTWIGGIANISTSKIGHINICTYWNATSAGGVLHIVAIGRWK